MTPPTVATLSQIAGDIPCLRCGYNLRGLDPQGQCPECAHLVHVSVLAWEEQRRDGPLMDEADPRWVRQLIEGLLLSLLVFALMVTGASAPTWHAGWRSSPFVLSLACATWVLSWASVWRVTAAEPTSRPRGEVARRTLRIAATLFPALPAVETVLIEYDVPEVVAVTTVPALWLAGVVAAGGWFVHVGNLARRTGSRSLWIQSRFLALIGVGVCILFLLVPPPSAQPGASRLLWLPLCQFGPGFLLNAWLDNDGVPSFVLAMSLLPLWGALLTLRRLLLLLLVYAARRAGSSKIV